jgi:hypothetical protein
MWSGAGPRDHPPPARRLSKARCHSDNSCSIQLLDNRRGIESSYSTFFVEYLHNLAVDHVTPVIRLLLPVPAGGGRTSWRAIRSTLWTPAGPDAVTVMIRQPSLAMALCSPIAWPDQSQSTEPLYRSLRHEHGGDDWAIWSSDGARDYLNLEQIDPSKRPAGKQSSNSDNASTCTRTH